MASRLGVVFVLVLAALAAWTAAEARPAVKCEGKRATVRGTGGADELRGTRKADVIAGRGGNDTIDGRKGNDLICGGPGDDSIAGGEGDDQGNGGADDDTIIGDAGVDELLGDGGVDHLSDDSPGADTLTGGPNVDVCTHSEDDIVDCDFDPSDPVVFVPFEESPSPGDFPVEVAGRVASVDLYTILDRSGSMATEITTLKNNLATVVDGLQCEPFGSGEPGDCIPDLSAGAGTVGYSSSGAAAFQNWVDLQSDPNFATVPTTDPATSPTTEPLTFAVHAAITGSGGASFGMPSVPARTNCGPNRFGYPCFREGALPIIALATDEPPLLDGSDTVENPNWDTVVKTEMVAQDARFVGLLGDNAVAGTQSDLQEMATDTGAFDAHNENAPAVFDGGGASAATALGNGIRTLLSGVPLDFVATPVDDPADFADAVQSFVDHVEVQPAGDPECTTGLNSADDNNDGFDERYVGVPNGTPLCWTLVAKQNTTVPATSDPQLFSATVTVTSENDAPVDEREVYFVVPGTD